MRKNSPEPEEESAPGHCLYEAQYIVPDRFAMTSLLYLQFLISCARDTARTSCSTHSEAHEEGRGMLFSAERTKLCFKISSYSLRLKVKPRESLLAKDMEFDIC